MATATVSYGTPANLTITLASLATASWRESTYVDNATDLFVDVLVSGTIRSSGTAGNTIDIYAYGYDGTAYTAGATGSDAAYTADGEEDELIHVATITVDGTASQDFVWGPTALARKFGGVIPSRWGLVVRNGSGATLDATGGNHRITYVGIKYDSA